MKVKELIELLNKQDQEMDIMLYLNESEDGSMLSGHCVQTCSDPETLKYFKGDNPMNYEVGLTNEVFTLVSN